MSKSHVFFVGGSGILRGRFFGGGKTPPYSTTRQRLPLRGTPAARRVKGGPWGRNQHPATLQSPSVTASLKGSLLGPRVRRADMESAPTARTQIGVYPVRADDEHRPLQNGGILAPEGPDGEGRKSVKKRAALLHVLAFCFFDLLFGVPRGERLAAHNERRQFAAQTRSCGYSPRWGEHCSLPSFAALNCGPLLATPQSPRPGLPRYRK